MINSDTYFSVILQSSVLFDEFNDILKSFIQEDSYCHLQMDCDNYSTSAETVAEQVRSRMESVLESGMHSILFLIILDKQTLLKIADLRDKITELTSPFIKKVRGNHLFSICCEADSGNDSNEVSTMKGQLENLIGLLFRNYGLIKNVIFSVDGKMDLNSIKMHLISRIAGEFATFNNLHREIDSQYAYNVIYGLEFNDILFQRIFLFEQSQIIQRQLTGKEFTELSYDEYVKKLSKKIFFLLLEKETQSNETKKILSDLVNAISNQLVERIMKVPYPCEKKFKDSDEMFACVYKRYFDEILNDYSQEIKEKVCDAKYIGTIKAYEEFYIKAMKKIVDTISELKSYESLNTSIETANDIGSLKNQLIEYLKGRFSSSIITKLKDVLSKQCNRENMNKEIAEIRAEKSGKKDSLEQMGGFRGNCAFRRLYSPIEPSSISVDSWKEESEVIIQKYSELIRDKIQELSQTSPYYELLDDSINLMRGKVDRFISNRCDCFPGNDDLYTIITSDNGNEGMRNERWHYVHGLPNNYAAVYKITKHKEITEINQFKKKEDLEL